MISVLVVDDSAFMRKMISIIVSGDPELTVCGTAKDGVEAVDKAMTLKPDVITLDIEMPEMDGISALKLIMKRAPTAVLMLSALTKKGGELTMEALENGAVDFVTKPSGTISLDIMKIKEEIVAKIKAAHRSKKIAIRKVEPISFEFRGEGKKAVVIASSTGGPATLEQIIPRFSKSTPAPIFVVQHMPPGFTQALASRLNVLSQMAVKEAIDGEEVKEGVVYIAPGGFHMLVKSARVENEVKSFISLSLDPAILGLRPYADITIKSVVEIYGKRTVCIILTGMGEDGTEGARKVKEGKGQVYVEDEKDCVIFGMPGSALKAGVVDEIVPLDHLAEKIAEAIEKA